ncbi:hypothetical protein HMPREF1544_01601 [Mucor circinelloides 1006PhL]|uniref:Uncharacterized protein n=1 Tax=Mucor circinelloides f. circinelloides (strain 1006PhL) TaxID=1220926 RepID=S2KGE9_MUCC1|nr:hypothetical protein HMPREF1544_01601 [Mucor circinelloides 1006PhL]
MLKGYTMHTCRIITSHLEEHTPGQKHRQENCSSSQEKSHCQVHGGCTHLFTPTLLYFFI